MIAKLLPYLAAFLGSLVATLVLTPVVRELNRRLGMVDAPDARRINTKPIPRGGGLAIVLGLALSYSVFLWVTGRPGIAGVPDEVFAKMSVLAVAMAALGLADDKFSLSPKAKLAGQGAIALLVWWWADLGFNDLWPAIPAWLDCLLTLFWIVGAVNAFNLIDGMDGLASGIALIAVVGMAGALFFVRDPASMLFYFAFAGGLLGFLRYNYNPASVFLGDCGSMFIGFVLSTLPLASHVPNSFLVSVGVPLLALRRMILRGGGGAGRVMGADLDHLHHRLLRRTGFNQRTAAWTLYGIAAAGVFVWFVAMFLESRAGGLWLAAITLFAVVVFKDATVELFDAGRLLNRFAHAQDKASRRRIAVWTVPFYIVFDLVALVGAYFLCTVSLGIRPDVHAFRSYLPIRVVATFAFLVLFNAYRTVWSRAVWSNYFRLLLACLFGAVAGSVFIYYWPSTDVARIDAMTAAFAIVSFALLTGMRMFRSFCRDVFYAIDCSRIRNRKDVSRILVYGAGLRYKSFRSELVRSASANERIIVGLLDDDVFMKGRYIGGIRIYGTINDAPAVINRLNVDAVVIACEISDEWLRVVQKILAPTGVKITLFSFSEKPVLSIRSRVAGE